jgi:3-phosphoglycerate kinase
MVDLAKQLLGEAEAKGVALILPTDVLCADAFDNNAATKVSWLVG